MPRALSRISLISILAAVSVAAAGFAVHTAAPGDAGAQEASKRAWLGVVLDKSPAGVVAKRVVGNSPAAKAGMADGDTIVVADGVAVSEPSQIIARVALLGPGSAMTLKIRRAGVEKSVTAALVPFPDKEALLRLDMIGKFAPAWKTATAVSGSLPASPGAMRGKVMLLDFWASWCMPCRMIAPRLAAMQNKYGAQGLSVIGFTTDPVSNAASSAQAMGMTYTVASDASEAVNQAYSVLALPSLFLVDKRGVIREAWVGFDPSRTAEIEKAVQAALAEPNP
jgi:peroxiredoxin